MRDFLLTAKSTNKKSFSNFFKILEKNFKNKQNNIIKIKRPLKKKKIVTILKSPHVNKTAQEQFEKREYSIQIFLISKNSNKTIIRIKKLLNKLFHDLKFTIKYLENNNTYKKYNALCILTNTNFKLNKVCKINENKTLWTQQKIKRVYSNKKYIILKTYFNLLNSHGEIVLNN